MTRHYLMGLDVGGGGARCLLVGVNDGETFVTTHAWTHLPAPDTGGWGFDFAIERNWELIGQAVREALHQAGASPDQVLGIAATSMRHAVVVLDEQGREILATPNKDARAASEGMALGESRGGEFHQRTGHWPSPIFAAARLRWMAAHAPHLLDQARTMLSLSDWVAYRLCGELAAEPSQAGETLLFDLHSRDWAWDLIDSLELPQRIFPTIRQPGAAIGALTRDAAEHLGLAPGIPVALGGGDTQCGLLGAGAVMPGQMGLIAGTTAPLQLVVDRPLIDSEARLWTGLHVIDGLWVIESNAGAMGETLDWIAAALYPDSPNPAGALMAEAAESTPGAAGLLSTLGVQVFNAAALSLPIGHLTVTHLIAAADPARRRHVARAVIEGLACSVRANSDQISAVSHIAHPEVHVAGGMSRSRLWTQMVSEVLGAPVRVSITPEATALGAAICAGVGAGVFRSLVEGAQALVRLEDRTPDESRMRTYHEVYAGWQQVREAHTEADSIAAGLILQTMMEVPPQPGAPAVPGFRPRLLITADVDEAALAALGALGEVRYAPFREEMRLLAGPDLVEELQGYHVLVTEVDVVDADSMRQLPDLRVVAVCRGNPVNVDVAAATALGIPVIYTPGRNADAVADLTVALMLMLARKLVDAAAFLRQPGIEAGDAGRQGQAFMSLGGRELWRKTVGLIGLGAVGRKVAQRLRPFGARILAFDPYLDPDQAALCGAERASLERLLEMSDFVSLHAAVTDETRNLLDAQALARMKRGAFVINTARAALLDEDALLEALRSGHLGGAALDVFSVEPPGSDHPLLQLPNVIATPHIGGNTAEVAAHQGQIVADELARLLRGDRPRFVRNPETLLSFTWDGPRRSPPDEVLAQLAAAPPPAVSDLQQQELSARQPAGPLVTPEARPAPVEPSKRGGILSGLRKLVGSREETAPPPTSAPAPLPPSSGVDDVRGKMERILAAFLDALTASESLRQFSVGRHVTMHYTLSDLGIDFIMGFHDGTVIGRLGKPDQPAEIQLRMKADILDGMFTGRTNPTRAAMSGKLSFSGDASKAMALQRIQKDLSALYSQAREEVGDPGDLSAIEAAPAPAAAPATPAVERIAAAPAVVRTGVGDIRDEIVRVTTELYEMGLITATGGNISARLEDDPTQVWITPSQIFKGDLRADMMVRIDLDGQVLDPGALAASSERKVHCAIYRARPDVQAVIHTHAPQATVLALAELPFLPISTEAAFIGEIPRVPFIMPGTTELADAVATALGKGIAVLMQNHGLVVAGSSLRRAADMSDAIEQTAKKLVTCHLLGREPSVLPAETVAMLREIGEAMV